MSFLAHLYYAYALVHIVLKIPVSCDELPFYIDYPSDVEITPNPDANSSPISDQKAGELILHYKFPPLFAFPSNFFSNDRGSPEKEDPPPSDFNQNFAYSARAGPSEAPVNGRRPSKISPLHRPEKNTKDVPKLSWFGAGRPDKTTKDVLKLTNGEEGLPHHEQESSEIKAKPENIKNLDFLKPTRRGSDSDSDSDESDEDESGERLCPSKDSKVNGGKGENKQKTIKPIASFGSTKGRPKKRTKSLHCRCGVPPKQRIINGVKTHIHKHPWMILQVMSKSNNPYCGGTLINNQYILTAAHCLDGVKPSEMYITLGHTNSQNPGINVTVEKFIQHERYDKYHFEENDIALIKLSLPLRFYESFIPRTVCIPETTNNYSNQSAVITGWGVYDETNKISDNLQEGNVTIWEYNQCQDKSYYSPHDLNPNVVCAKGKSIDSCQGDSGGPLSMERGGAYIQVGITSWGVGCADDHYPGVYTKIAQFHEWITQNTGDAIYCTPPGRINNVGGFRMQIPFDPALNGKDSAHGEPLGDVQQAHVSSADKTH